MGYLSTALNRITDKNGLKQADVVRESGLDKSTVSRLFNAEKLAIADDDFLKLLRSFRRHPEEQAELIAARCMDVRIGPGAELVDIRVKKSAPSSRGERNFGFPDVELSHDGERAFAWLRSQCPLNPELEKHLIGFANMITDKNSVHHGLRSRCLHTAINYALFRGCTKVCAIHVFDAAGTLQRVILADQTNYDAVPIIPASVAWRNPEPALG